jgi:modulator of FtsH protease
MNLQPVRTDAAYQGSGSSSAAERNRVLRNTYWLLALSMVPTVLGAWLGVSTGLARAMSPGIGLVVFLVGAFGFMFAIEKTKNSAAGVPVLLAFTFFMGIDAVAPGRCGARPEQRRQPDHDWPSPAPAAIFLGMATLSTVIKRDLTSMGKLAVHRRDHAAGGRHREHLHPVQRADDGTLSVLAVGIFSAFILHDLKRVRDGEETNYITATLGVYLSLYNVFQSLLAIFGLTSGGSDD